jgi:hypothetical protein
MNVTRSPKSEATNTRGKQDTKNVDSSSLLSSGK